MAKIYPSLLSSDLLNIRKTLEVLNPHVDGYHLDVIDGHFAPSLGLGIDCVNTISQETTVPLTVHLMVKNPTDWIEKFVINDHSTIIFHHESEGSIQKNIEAIKNKTYYVGIALNPQSPVEEIFPVLETIDTVLLMSVEPGFSGQPFLEDVIKKINPLTGYRQTSGLKFTIGMDGGIDEKNIGMLAEKGVDWFGIGSAIFDAPNYLKAFQEIKKASIF